MANQPLYSPINPHFFQPLLPGFTNYLDIPVAFFSKHLEKINQGKTAELRSDASETTWKVKIDGKRLSNGWEDFAIAHDLRVGDIVVFRHEGDLVFHVSALGPSCCEIQYGDSDKEDKTENISRTKKSPKREADSLTELTKPSKVNLKPSKREANSSTDQSCFVVTVTASNLKRDTVYLPKSFVMLNGLMKKCEIALVNDEGESWKIYFRHEVYSDRFYMRRGWRSFCVAIEKKPGDVLRFKLVRDDDIPLLQLLPLNSDDLGKFEKVPKKKRQEREQDSSPDHSCFVAIVTDSNLNRDTVYLPKKFAMLNSLIKKVQIDLMNEKGESWRIDLRHETSSGRFLMRRGWRSFCVANGKKPGDFFRFKLVQNEETPVLKLFPLNLHKLEPSNDTSNDTRQGLEATKKEFLGVETNRNETSQGRCFKGSKKDYLPSGEPNNRFVTLTLTPTSFQTRRLNLPLEFTKGNGINKAGMITMLDRYGSKWSTAILMDKNKRGTMSLGRGWKGFCEVNGVKMDESIVLELVWEDTVPILKFCSRS